MKDYLVRILIDNTYFTRALKADTFDIDEMGRLHFIKAGQSTPILTINSGVWLYTMEKSADEVPADSGK